MDSKVNINIFGNEYNNSNLLFITKDSIVFEYKNEIYCELISAVDVYKNDQKIDIKSNKYDTSVLELYKVKANFMSKIQHLYLLKEIGSLYVFVNPKYGHEILIFSNDIESLGKLENEYS